MPQASANPADIDNLSVLLKPKYGSGLDNLVVSDSPFYDKVEEMGETDFSVDFGGQKYVWTALTKRANNTYARGRTDYQPGYSGSAGDTLQRRDGLQFESNRRFVLGGTPMDWHWMQSIHDNFSYSDAHRIAGDLMEAEQDTRAQLQRMLLGDRTGFLGQVESVSYSGGYTTVNLVSATDAEVTDRGIGGTQHIQANMRLMRIPNAHTGNLRTAQADDSFIFLVDDVSDPYDVSASPSFTVAGDVRAYITANDVLVPHGSRTSTTGGSATGATLHEFNGLQAMIDDGTIDDDYYGQSRASNPILKSKVDYSTTRRPFTPEMLTLGFYDLKRRLGDEAEQLNGKFSIFSEHGAKAAYPFDHLMPAVQFDMKDKAYAAVHGFTDVSFAVINRTQVVPWATHRSFPYGQVLLTNFRGLKAMWDKRPGDLDDDGLDLRKVPGLLQFIKETIAVGEFVHEEPWCSYKWTGIEGRYTV